jgi:hypothetical protein
MSGSIAMKAFFWSIFGVYIGLGYLITFEGKITEILSENSDIYFRLYELKELSKR